MLFKFVVIKQELQKEFEFDSVYNVLVVTCTFNISETLHFSVVDGKQRTPLPSTPAPRPMKRQEEAAYATTKKRTSLFEQKMKHWNLNKVNKLIHMKTHNYNLLALPSGSKTFVSLAINGTN